MLGRAPAQKSTTYQTSGGQVTCGAASPALSHPLAELRDGEMGEFPDEPAASPLPRTTSDLPANRFFLQVLVTFFRLTSIVMIPSTQKSNKINFSELGRTGAGTTRK